MSRRLAFDHPYDTPLTSTLRFLTELIAWVGGPWAVAQFSVWLVAPTLVILVALPAIFSTPGDKRQVVVATAGWLRVPLELGLHVVAVAAAWIVWPIWIAIPATLIVIAAIGAGLPRTRWLLRGAPNASYGIDGS